MRVLYNGTILYKFFYYHRGLSLNNLPFYVTNIYRYSDIKRVYISILKKTYGNS